MRSNCLSSAKTTAGFNQRHDLWAIAGFDLEMAHRDLNFDDRLRLRKHDHLRPPSGCPESQQVLQSVFGRDVVEAHHPNEVRRGGRRRLEESQRSLTGFLLGWQPDAILKIQNCPVGADGYGLSEPLRSVRGREKKISCQSKALHVRSR